MSPTAHHLAHSRITNIDTCGHIAFWLHWVLKEKPGGNFPKSHWRKRAGRVENTSTWPDPASSQPVLGHADAACCPVASSSPVPPTATWLCCAPPTGGRALLLLLTAPQNEGVRAIYPTYIWKIKKNNNFNSLVWLDVKGILEGVRKRARNEQQTDGALLLLHHLSFSSPSSFSLLPSWVPPLTDHLGCPSSFVGVWTTFLNCWEYTARARRADRTL